eukprot:TRINITY_DN11808_c0_g1_i1.p1 TRINITY_DN11808_c0_g1~~TRINITY_DN11808_c0_g1_i1.p1  ORF type:complete len:131 (-),score=10.69 TRINITY_DN11808_c0_g1_i1:223-585(-)
MGDDIDYTRAVPAEKKLRACLVCGLVKGRGQFHERGCDNCNFLNIKGDWVDVEQATSANFDGVIAMMDTANSWVAKWQGHKSIYIPGVYAVSVSGILPQHFIERMESKGLIYRPLSNRQQ